MMSKLVWGLEGFCGKATASMAPAVILTLFFLGAYAIYRIKFRRGNYPRFAEVEKRPATKMLSRHFRTFLLWCINPLERFFVGAKVNPNWITMSSLVFATLSGIMLALGNLGAGGWLYIFSGICDVFDGRVARKTHRVTSFGGILDSVTDRYAEFLVFAGLAWFYSNSWVFVAVLFALFGSLMVSYVRAKAESMQIQCTVGSFQRAERLVYLGVGLALSPIATEIFSPLGVPENWLAVAVIIFIAMGANLTALYRLLFTLQEAKQCSEVATSVLSLGVATQSNIMERDRHDMLEDGIHVP